MPRQALDRYSRADDERKRLLCQGRWPSPRIVHQTLESSVSARRTALRASCTGSLLSASVT